MYTQGQRAEKWIAAVVAGAVLSVGLVVSFLVYEQHARVNRERRAEEFQQTARQYAFMLQRQLDVYAAASQSLAAYVGANDVIASKGFESFIKGAGYFGQLKGIRSLGYLAHVPAKDAPAFERRAAREFPHYRIHGIRQGAQVYYPMLYIVHADGEQRGDQLRGFDVSSRQECLDTIHAAEAGGRATVSPLLPPLGSDKPSILLTVVPARTAREANARLDPGGLVFVAMNAPTLFERIDNGRMLSLFGFEVYRLIGGQRAVVFDPDGAPQSISTAQHFYSSQLHYADQSWEVRFFPKQAFLAEHADRHSLTVLAVGVLLSLIATYATFRLAQHVVGRHASAELARRFHTFFAQHPFAVYTLDREHRFAFVNQKMARQLGVDADALVGAPSDRFIVPENRAMTEAYFREALAGQAVAYNNRVVNAKGESEDLSVVLFPVLVGGEVTHVLAFAENITERKRFERELYESREKLQLILDTVPLWVFWKDRDSVYQGANRRALEAAGVERQEQIVGLTDDALSWSRFAGVYRDEDRRVIESGEPSLNNQQPYQLGDGSPGWVEVSKVPLRDEDGNIVGLLGVAHDITENKRMEVELLRRANHDSLTGLPNRAFFSAELRQAIKRAQRSSGELALLYFDIDRFKLINDTFGHDVGDKAICTFAQRARGVLRESDFLARLGGDEFVLIVEELAARADVDGVADKLVAAMQAPFALGDREHRVSTSIGIAFLDAGMSADRLIKAADDAMYLAKRAGRNCYRHACLAED